jgi:anti-anti-sigma factor
VAEVVAPECRSDDPGVEPSLVVHADNDVVFRRYSSAAWTVIEIVGEIDAAVAPAMRKMLDGALTPQVIFDLRQVSFMDASGLGVLGAALRRGRSMGGTVRLVGPGARVTRTLQITGLDKVLAIYGTLEAATG